MHIVLGVSGGIAAYKTPDVVRRLRDVGAEVRVILTPNAARFVSPLSLAAVSGNGVIIEQWGDSGHGGVDHIELARWADLLLIAPATANIIAKLVVGLADDALSTYAIAHRGSMIVAPAMNTTMLRHTTVQKNLLTLKERGVTVLDPDSGLLACGDEGSGRMPDPHVLADFVRRQSTVRDLDGVKILVTAGPTRESIDPVRFISNRSSGKMGYALASAAAARGANVTLISGPTGLTRPPEVRFQQVTSAAEMHGVVMNALPESEVVIMAAAVSDFTPAAVAGQKIKRSGQETLDLALRKAPDILADIAAMAARPFIVAFAAETSDIESNAREKLIRKRADIIVANDVADPSIGFDSDSNAVTIISADGSTVRVDRSAKIVVANQILDVVVAQRK